MGSKNLPGFVRLNDFTSFYQPPQTNGHTKAPSSPSNAPDLIILCSWMAAAPKHIKKYTDGYRLAFPSAEILLIESSFYGVTFGADLTTAVDFLASYVKDSSPSTNDGRKRALLSIFSNGGASMGLMLAMALLSKYGSTPFDAMILDCCPTKGSIETVTKAVTLSLPNQPAVRLVGWYLVYAFVVSYAVVVRTLGIEDVGTRNIRLSNDPKIFSTEVPRLYMYSKKDELVPFEDVRTHAEGARAAGCSVREEVFETASHCALLNEDSERYWNAVKTHVAGSK